MKLLKLHLSCKRRQKKIGTNKIILDEASLQQWWENKLRQSVQPKRPEGYGRLRKIAE